MTVLVTGGAGFIGSHMVYHLCDAHERVVVLDNLTTGYPWLLDQRAKLVIGNVADIALVKRVIAENDVTAIIHFAGSIVVPESVSNPLFYYENNTASTRNLIQAAVECGITDFIFSSTAAVYGMTDLEPVTEDHALAPISPYGRSKMMSEMMLADIAAAHSLRYGVLRYFNVAGADPRQRTGQTAARATHLIKVACQTALGLRPGMSVFGTDYPTPDGTCLRDFIHVSDLVAAHANLLDYLRSGGESVTLNCGYGSGFSVREVIDMVENVSGRTISTQLQPRRAGDPAAVVADASRLRTLLHWQPQHQELRGIIESAFAWERYLSLRADRPEVA